MMASVSYTDLQNQMEDIERNLQEQRYNAAGDNNETFDYKTELSAKSKVLFRGTVATYTIAGVLVAGLMLLMAKDNGGVKATALALIFAFIALALASYFKPDMVYSFVKNIPLINKIQP